MNFRYYDHLKLRHLIYWKPYSFLHFLHPVYLWLETTFGTVQKWSLRPLLDSPKGGLNKGNGLNIGILLYSLDRTIRVVLTSTQNLFFSFWAKLRAVIFTPVNTTFPYINLSFPGGSHGLVHLMPCPQGTSLEPKTARVTRYRTSHTEDDTQAIEKLCKNSCFLYRLILR